MNPILKVKYLVKDLSPISYSREGDASIELRASGRFTINLDAVKKDIEQESYEIKPGERILVKTGIQVEIPKGYWGNIRDRSGIALNQGLHNLAGVIDENYRGEIGVVVINLNSVFNQIIKKNDRIAQMIISPYTLVNIVEQENLSETNRGEKGFGSSGKS